MVDVGHVGGKLVVVVTIPLLKQAMHWPEKLTWKTCHHACEVPLARPGIFTPGFLGTRHTTKNSFIYFAGRSTLKT